MPSTDLDNALPLRGQVRPVSCLHENFLSLLGRFRSCPADLRDPLGQLRQDVFVMLRTDLLSPALR